MSLNKSGVVIIEGHIQGLSNTRSLGEAGIPVYVVDKINCIAKYSKYCKKYFKCPDFINPDFADFLIELAIKEHISDWVLLPSNDHAVYTISKNKDKLEKYYKIITPRFNIIKNIYDKVIFIDIARVNNIPTPITKTFKNTNELMIDDFNYPVITKGRNSLTFYKKIGKKVLLASNKNELIKQLKFVDKIYNINNIFTQELVPFNGKNKTISFTAFCEEGDIKTYWIGVKLREHPIRFGTATFTESINNKECYHLSVRLLKALKYTGVCEVEYLFDPRDNKYKLIEMNARTWLWVGLAKACGIDYAKLIYDYLNRINIVYPKGYNIGVRWINYLTDFIMAFKYIKSKEISLRDYLKSLKGEKVNAVFKWGDNKPAIALFIFAFYLAKKRNII